MPSQTPTTFVSSLFLGQLRNQDGTSEKLNVFGRRAILSLYSFELLNIFWNSWSCQLVIALKLVSRRMLKSETGQICKSFLSHSQYFSVFVGIQIQKCVSEISVFVGIHIQKESLVKLGLIPSAKHSFPSGRLKSANPLAGGVLNNKQRRKIINRN